MFVGRVLELYVNRAVFFVQLLGEHVLLCAWAIALISLIGVSTGIWIVRNERSARYVLAASDFLYTIPSIALFGFLVALTGIGNTSALIALVLYGILPMLRATYTGIREVDPQLLETAKAMGSTEKQLLYRVQLPLALPVIFSGFRTMVIMTIALGGIASFIGAGGLGVAIWRGITTNNPEMTVAGSLLVALLAISVDWLIAKGERKLRRSLLGEA